MHYASDHVGSDDMDDILELSRNDLLSNRQHASTSKVPLERLVDEPLYLAKPRLQARLRVLAQEISSIENSVADLQRMKAELLREENTVKKELSALDSNRGGLAHKDSTNGMGKEVMRQSSQINYMDEFEWSGPLKATMKSVFGIDSFRLCQEGVCNASMDGRDVVCVMPTGGGKSLTYQLPAIMSRGCTLVISPLLSLITDQILHLRQAGVEAVMLTGATPKEESKAVFSRLTASTREGIGPVDRPRDKEIKLCYVTPEKIAKSKTFTSMLEKLATVGKLARIVIDEAHCVSQLGHDFRPDYKKLSILRQLFPHVPILALSATCPPKVLQDLLLTLRLKPVVDGNAADKTGTVYFTAPLYRKNLHYRVLPKPSSAPAVIQAMADYILEHHAHSSGIIYCLSKKDTETVAQGIIDASGGKVKAGVYHSDVTDAQKERLHVKWRSGEVQVVCATIAFGLGIDKSNVRFVLHHSMSKSLDGFYQESGRAGRDSNDADCILYYRGQDASRLSALICGEIEGQDKLYEMLRFAQNLIDCRKIQFANYFSSSSSLALSSWSDTTEAGTLSRCGHCDNCTRPPDSITTRDVTLESWQVLRVVERISRDRGRVTVGMLADLVRGAGGGAFSSGAGSRRKGKGKASTLSKEKVGLDLSDIAGEKITMSKPDVEVLIIQLLLSHHLKEEFHSTAYSINVYVTSGPQALRLTRLSRQQVLNGEGSRVSCTFLNKVVTKRKAPSKSTAKSKHKLLAAVESGDEEEINIDVGSDDHDNDSDGENSSKADPSKAAHLSTIKSKPRPRPQAKQTMDDSWRINSKSTSNNRKFNPLTKPVMDSEYQESDNDIPWDIDNVQGKQAKLGRRGEKSLASKGLDIIGQIDPTIFVPSSDAEDSDTNGWSYNLSGPTKRKAGEASSAAGSASKKSKIASSSKSRPHIGNDAHDVVVLSSD